MTEYLSELIGDQWAMISKYFDMKRIKKYDLGEIVNCIMYLVKIGCQWRMLPWDFTTWKIV